MNKKIIKYSNVLIVLGGLLLSCIYTQAQPVNNSKRTVNGITIYSDFKDASVAYYVQGEMKLATNSDGSPKLKIVSLQKECGEETGIQLTNVAQVSVELNNYTASAIELLRKTLGKKLKPLPIERIEAHLLCPAIKGTKWINLGQESKDSSVIWTDQTFTVPMENQEAEVLWTQIKEERLALSFNAYYYAEMLVVKKTREININGDTSLISQLKTIAPKPEVDTIQHTILAKSDAFAVAADLKKYPHILEVDIVSCHTFPKQAAIAISCLDFSRGIRPNLFRKTIQLEAYRPNGKKAIVEGSFSRDNKVERIYLKFDHLISTRRPLNYTVVEYPNNDYEVPIHHTYKMDEWKGRLDITTRMLENHLSNETFYIEAAPEDWQSFVHSVSYQYDYVSNGKAEQLIGSISKEDASFLNTHHIFYDGDTMPRLAIQWLTIKGTIVKKEEYELEDFYFFVPF